MKLEKYSMGIGDRFAHQGKAQLSAIIMAKKELGIDITPVWNKSHREHTTIKTTPASVRNEADSAVKTLSWKDSYYVDADHIGLNNVDLFIGSSDFFTLDVADFMGNEISSEEIDLFVNKYSYLIGTLDVPGIDTPLEIKKEQITQIAKKVLAAVKEAGKIYRHIEKQKENGNFITEVSMDETDLPQTPVEMLFILAAIADEGIPAQTIAPKFTGRFNKGVDYVGNVDIFKKEFEEDLAVIKFAIKEFSLPENLKLSVHSGSDKFSIYEPIKKALLKFDAGIHVKTAGTTWLEEIIGLALAGGEGLDIAKDVYAKSYTRYDELAKPYASVIDIDQTALPKPELVNSWTKEEFANALIHVQECPEYNINMRQLIHVGYKIAAELGSTYLDALEKFETIVGENVCKNIFERHIKRIFPR